MLNRILIIAGQEITSGLRDSRGLVSALLYSLMGPGVVYMVSLATAGKGQGSAAVLTGMMSVFTLVAVFVGGMSVAMDVLAGERERRSLLPLLLNPVSRRELIAGKWLAVSFFCLAGLLINVAGFAVVFAAAGMRVRGHAASLLLTVCAGLAPLALLAAALELALSTICRAVKEAHTYLSLLVFLPMGLGMFMVFFPQAGREWWRVVPVVGQQWQLETWMQGGAIPWFDGVLLAIVTFAITACVLLGTASRLERDDVVYGN